MQTRPGPLRVSSAFLVNPPPSFTEYCSLLTGFTPLPARSPASRLRPLPPPPRHLPAFPPARRAQRNPAASPPNRRPPGPPQPGTRPLVIPPIQTFAPLRLRRPLRDFSCPSWIKCAFFHLLRVLRRSGAFLQPISQRRRVLRGSNVLFSAESFVWISVDWWITLFAVDSRVEPFMFYLEYCQTPGCGSAARRNRGTPLARRAGRSRAACRSAQAP